jgi:hypothetical protein
MTPATPASGLHTVANGVLPKRALGVVAHVRVAEVRFIVALLGVADWGPI